MMTLGQSRISNSSEQLGTAAHIGKQIS